MKSFYQKGFTLIELLVVIGILGILASALVATIDPFEQLNKANDANVKNVAVEFLNANIRYYTTHNAMPWDSVANNGADCLSGNSNPSGVKLSTMNTCLDALSADGELKAGFKNVTNATSKIYITEPNPQTSNQNDISVCFTPVSKSQQRDANVKYDATTHTGADSSVACKSANPPGTNDCDWCAQ